MDCLRHSLTYGVGLVVRRLFWRRFLSRQSSAVWRLVYQGCRRTNCVSALLLPIAVVADLLYSDDNTDVRQAPVQLRTP